MTEIKPQSPGSKSTAKPVAKRSRRSKTQAGDFPPDSESRIREAAYFKALSRGFTPGYELDDWLAAEKEVSQ